MTIFLIEFLFPLAHIKVAKKESQFSCLSNVKSSSRCAHI